MEKETSSTPCIERRISPYHYCFLLCYCLISTIKKFILFKLLFLIPFEVFSFSPTFWQNNLVLILSIGYILKTHGVLHIYILQELLIVLPLESQIQINYSWRYLQDKNLFGYDNKVWYFSGPNITRGRLFDKPILRQNFYSNI